MVVDNIYNRLLNWLNESNRNIVTSTDGPHCNSMERERPDGEDEDNDELDPRVEVNLTC